MKIGDKVVIKKSWHPDVTTGQVGEVSDRGPGGFGIRIEANFISGFNQRNKEFRTLFFRRDEIKPI